MSTNQKDKEYLEHLADSKIVNVEVENELKSPLSPMQWRSTCRVPFPTSATV